MSTPSSAAPPDLVVLQEIARAVRKEIARLKRRLVAIGRDVAREADGRELQHRAELLVHSKLPARGASEIEVVDYALDPPQSVVVPLDTALSPRSQVEAWFKTARRYLRGAELGRVRAGETHVDIVWLETALGVLEHHEVDATELAALLADPRIAKFSQPAAPRIRADRVVTSRRSFREFVGHGGARILVGRGARDNDELTTRVARPQDLFLHVQGATGAHVIVPRTKGEQVPAELLRDAALLAHHFSSAATDGRSDITYCERRYVQKRRGAPAGTVQLLRAKVMHLLVEPTRLARLIESEARTA